MKTKKEIVEDWLTRYTGQPLDGFGRHILLVNFDHYITLFCQLKGTRIVDASRNMPTATAEDISIIKFGMGSANAATIMDLLSAIKPKAVLFLGKCGGLKKKSQVGDLILPIAAIRNEGTSDNYMPPEVPAMPAFSLQRAVSSTIRDHALDYWTGTVLTTNRRVWEHDNRFKKYLKSTRTMAIDMETATLFTVGFANQIPTGALLLVTDQPMISSGIKTTTSDENVTRDFVKRHVEIGIASLKEIIEGGRSVKHLKF